MAVALAAALLAGGCGGARVGGSVLAGVVNIGERDFQITGPDHVKAGRVTLRVANSGPDQHELIVVRASGSHLALRGDGLTVNEEALGREEPGVLEPGEPGAVRELEVNLTPGRYVFFCNMEGHYLGGMHHEIVVSR
jgi:uncharacterized cupredoxin-like copper-binding protein